MRTGVDIEIMPGGVQRILFDTPIKTPLPPPFNLIHSGYISVDATVRGIPLRFVSVHLVPNAGTILAHTLELALDEDRQPHVATGVRRRLQHHGRRSEQPELSHLPNAYHTTARASSTCLDRRLEPTAARPDVLPGPQVAECAVEPRPRTTRTWPFQNASLSRYDYPA